MGYVKGQLIASPLGRGSGMVTSFIKANGIVEVPQEVMRYESGARVLVRLLSPLGEIERNLVVVGSHDPLLDELADLLRINNRSASMGSSHAGSMGGIMAIRNNEAHLAGIHLLDEKTGAYNTSFVARYFPNGGVRLVECVKRLQGLIVPKGNPRQIRGIADLAQQGLRFVNRQKGSGTRILFDFLCRTGGFDPTGIYGYQREEYTHTSVAALVAAGDADVGFGILSASRQYDLDFIDAYEEQYDLLIPDHAWNLPVLQQLLEVLKSEAFTQRLQDLGGYLIDTPGSVRLR